MSSQRPIYIAVNTFSIVKIILICAIFYLMYLVKDILAILFISLILSSAFDPWVDWLQKRKIPRSVSILFIYLIAFILIGTTIVLIIPPIVSQINELTVKFPQISEKLSVGLEMVKSYSQKEGLLTDLLKAKDNYPQFVQTIQGLISQISNLFGGIITFILVLVLTFYMTVEENAMKKLIWSVAPEKHQIYIMNLVNRMQIKVGLWLRGQLILSFIIFVMVYVALSILGVKYALVLALLAGITEFVPYLGPIFAAIPAIIITFSQSGLALAVFVALIYYLVQLTENNIIVPKLMQKVVGLNPIVSIAVLMIGYSLYGVVGAILSIPVATAISVFVKDVFDSRSAGTKKEEAPN